MTGPSAVVVALCASAFLAPGGAAGVPLDRITRDEGFLATEGLDLLWKLQADSANVVLSSVAAELTGLKYYDSEYRWPAVYGGRGEIRVKVPRAGRFWPAIVVYDTAGREAYELSVGGVILGRFVAAEDDNRQRIHFLSRPVDFRGGETLVWRTAGPGNHVTEDILLLAANPPVRTRRFELDQLGAGYVVREGREEMRLTWISTWPAASTIEYGPTAAYGQKIVEPEAVANHRVYVPGLAHGTVHWRVVARRPDGSTLTSPDQVFQFQSPAPPVASVLQGRLTLRVENPHAFALRRFPVTSGVPMAQGELAAAEQARLWDPQGKPVEIQSKVTARWADGSVKWLLVSLLASVEAQKTAEYTLEYGRAVHTPPASKPFCQWQATRATVSTGPLVVEFDAARSGFPISVRSGGREMSGGAPTAAEVVAQPDETYTSAGSPATLQVEEAGPLRTVLKLTGHHAAAGRKFMAFTNRFTFYAGSPLVRLEYTWENDSPQPGLTPLESIGLDFPLFDAAEPKWTVGLGDGRSTSGQGDLALRQMRDDAFAITPQPPAGAKTRRADGWLDVSGPAGGLTVAVRDFWQLYPKAFRVARGRLHVDLCPDFEPGTYDTPNKLDEIKLYYYLTGGRYRVMQGLRKQHEVWLWFHPGGFTPAAAQIARAVAEPPIAVCTPERYCSTGVFGEIVPATAGRFPEYEKVCQQVYTHYVRNREAGREYGMLNFGDQWGERRVNWANGEYDHHHALLMQFARSADRRWYFLGEKAARHAIDVDTCHFGKPGGGEWIHSMGHTGGYFRKPFQGDGIPGPSMSVSHTWTEGFFDWHFLSGDPTAAENGRAVADHYDGAYLNNYDWGNCRTNGWHLLLTTAAWRATLDPFYLNAARIIVERTLERQSPRGGWQRQMVPGHCYDMPRHRGEANFMLGVLAGGLWAYYRDVPDPAVAAAFQGGARQVVRELWVEQSAGFRYTSCPNMKGYTANNDMTAGLLFAAHRLGGDAEFARIAMKAMEAAMRGGIGSIAHLRWTPHLIYDMDLVRRQKE